MTTAISVNNLSKQYKIGAAQQKFQYNMFRDVIVDTLMTPVRVIQALRGKSMRGATSTSMIWALDDVSFDLEEGKVLGIVGRNGAGKSTLLKILSRVTEPTKGTVSVRGRVGSLLEVGTGFHPELSGRENIYMNGAILGMKRAEIDKNFDEIVAFSEVGQFIDTPVKRYSSGMYLRLAFAVAAHLEPEILVVDEVLAVGDAEFQRKCLGKMNDVAQEGRTVLFVSHNMSAILRLTQEAIVLDKGKLLKRAPTPEAVDFYLSSGQAESGQRIWGVDDIPATSEPFKPVAVRIKDGSGNVVDTIRSIEPVTIEMEYQINAPVTGLRVGIYISTMRGEYIFTAFDTDDAKQYEQFGARQAGRYVSRCTVPADFFNEGRYSLGVNASSFGVKRYFMDENALSFNVDISGAPGTQWPELRQGPVRPRFDWKIEKLD
ncbi:MAG TPA: ABC transporter ATP-binding protein [Anaerolineales bacterium]|nr:ABC transporter ATP-binding protein [Anaerolineales bacterium]